MASNKKNGTLRLGLIKRKEHFRGFQVFNFDLQTKSKTRKYRKGFVCFKF